MDKLNFKKQVLEKARKRQQELIDDFRARINELKNSEMNINEDQYDLQQKSQDDSSNEMINNLANQLNFAVEEMDLLNKMHVGDEIHDSVGLGTMVKTDKGTFFPCVSIERFEVKEQELFGISHHAPLFQAMKDKKAGETFSYHGNEYKILDLY